MSKELVPHGSHSVVTLGQNQALGLAALGTLALGATAGAMALGREVLRLRRQRAETEVGQPMQRSAPMTGIQVQQWSLRVVTVEETIVVRRITGR